MESHRRAAKASEAGWFAEQILPVEVRSGKKVTTFLAVTRDLGLPADKTNPVGSGISLGHPVGATGCILAVKALCELRRTGGRYALVTMCIGGGQGIAAIFERI